MLCQPQKQKIFFLVYISRMYLKLVSLWKSYILQSAWTIKDNLVNMFNINNKDLFNFLKNIFL